jgi:hypothetical protein
MIIARRRWNLPLMREASVLEEDQLTLRFKASPRVFDRWMNRAASSSSGQTMPALVFPSVSCKAPAAAA